MHHRQGHHGSRIAAIALLAFALGGVGVGAADAADLGVRSAPPCPVVTPTPTPTPAPANTRGIDLSATVLGPTPSPAPTCGPNVPTGNQSNGAAPNVGYGVSGNSGTQGAGAGPAASVAPVSDTTGPGPDEFELGGVLYIGGLSSAYSPSIDPFGGEMQLWFTVRNVSKSTIDVRADFWMEGPFGNRIGQVDDVLVVDLKPGEKRTINAEVTGVGQWTFISAHAQVTPPKVVDDAELAPVTRDAAIFASPWLIGVIIVIVLGTAAVRHFLRRVDVPVPAGEMA